MKVSGVFQGKTSIAVFFFATEYFVQHGPVNNICTIIHTF